MTDTRHDTLINRGDTLFQEKSSLNSLHQEIADHFYPERADFTRTRYLGTDFASNLVSSYPPMMRRELGNAFSSTLRPIEIDWFKTTVADDERLSKASKQWLEHATRVQRRAMYDRVTNFVRATKEGDHDFAAFGQCVISIDYDPRSVALLYRTWHLRDAAWSERYNGQVGEIHLNWRPTVRDLASWFGKENLHESVQKCLEKEPNRRISCRRIVLPAEDYHMPGEPWRHPWVSVYVDLENKHPLQEVSILTKGHVIPRWQTVSGSQYAYSPATVVGLPDARLLQAMTLTLLEAGEMAVHPPFLVSGDHIREDVQNFPGGLTYIDGEYDKRKHDVLRPLNQDKGALPFGMDFAQEIRQMLAAAFYLNKLGLPPSEHERTAYETREMIKEYIRTARPLFEPAEYEYNHGICDATFQELYARGAFGSLTQIPEELQNRDVQFQFESPLHEAVDRQKGVTFLEAAQLTKTAFEMDRAAGNVYNFTSALRGALEGIKASPGDIRSQEEIAELVAEQQAQQQAQQAIEMAGAGAQAAEQLGRASEALA